jgi:coatomer protein complex subunit alpha (xenin)
MREVLPAIAFSLDDIRDNELAEANRFFSRGKFVESLAGFRTIIQKLLLVVAKDESEATDVSPPFALVPSHAIWPYNGEVG